jgi:succinoglycan biosynthesis transport protein ExoP
MLATAGSKVLLIDADLRRRAATRLYGEPDLGLADLGDGSHWQRLAQTHPETGLVTLLANQGEVADDGKDLLSSATMRRLLAEVRGAFDYVIIDLPPLGPMVDALSVLPWTDGFILVSEWGRTPRRLVRTMLEREPQLADQIIGVVLNRVDFSRLPRYTEAGGVERFMDVYQDYYDVREGAKLAPR